MADDMVFCGPMWSIRNGRLLSLGAENLSWGPYFCCRCCTTEDDSGAVAVMSTTLMPLPVVNGVCIWIKRIFNQRHVERNTVATIPNKTESRGTSRCLRDGIFGVTIATSHRYFLGCCHGAAERFGMCTVVRIALRIC